MTYDIESHVDKNLYSGTFFVLLTLHRWVWIFSFKNNCTFWEHASSYLSLIYCGKVPAKGLKTIDWRSFLFQKYIFTLVNNPETIDYERIKCFRKIKRKLDRRARCSKLNWWCKLFDFFLYNIYIYIMSIIYISIMSHKL